MSRLIDADAFIASLNEYINKPMTAGLCATLVEMFPTAYDVDEVERALQKEEKISEFSYMNSKCSNIKIYKLGRFIATQRAIIIVRRGWKK